MELREIIKQTVAEIRTSKNMEIRIAANEHPERTMTLEEVADTVEQVLQEATQALIDALDSQDRLDQPEQSNWWQGYSEGHPYDWRKDGIPEEGYLPRTSSWWDECS